MSETVNNPDRFVLDGIEVEEVHSAEMPFTNKCNFCVLKNSPCYDRIDVTCHSDSREDGTDVVFWNVANGEPPKRGSSPRILNMTDYFEQQSK